MQWTVRYFLKEAKTWKDRSLIKDLSSGAIAYAARQSATWLAHAVATERDFKIAYKDHVTLCI